MASSMPLSEEDLNCPICFEEYNLVEDDRMPKLLLCLHTVCFVCLENLVTDDEIVRCPICRTEHEINEDLEDLLDNDAVITHIRSKQEEEDKKAALEVYWKEWLEKCSDEIPNEELRANVQDLVRNSLIPLEGQPKSQSKPEEQDLKRRAQERQEQEYRHQQQLHQQHQRLLEQQRQTQQLHQHQYDQQQNRHVQQHNQQHNNSQGQQHSQSQQPNQEQENFNLTEFLGVLGQFFTQFDEEFNNPHSANERQDQHTNQNHQEVGEADQQQPHQEQELFDEEEGDNTEEDEDEGSVFYDEAEDEWYDYSDDDDDDDEEEEIEVVADTQSLQSQINESIVPYGMYHEYSDSDDDEVVEVTSDSDDEEVVVTATHTQQNYTNQQAATRVGRKIFITGDTVNKFADVGFIRNGFQDIYGSVQWINVYIGTEKCPCSYAILEFKNNVWFVEGDYNIDGQMFKAKLCSGARGKVFVARLPLNTEDDEITEYFEKFGNIHGFHRPDHYFTGNPVTYCFLTFNEEESKNEVLKYEDHSLDGGTFVVKPHVDR